MAGDTERRYEYTSMTALRAKENPRDYSFQIKAPNSPVAILAPHGGKIEPGTREIAEAIAGDTYRLFCFDGHRQRENMRYLHVESHLYDEAQCVDLIKQCQLVLAIHGCADPTGAPEMIYPGGNNTGFRAAITASLESAGFPVALFATTPERYKGVDRDNICNRGDNRSGGAQLEIARTLRDRLVPKPDQRGDRFQPFVAAIRGAIENALRKGA